MHATLPTYWSCAGVSGLPRAPLDLAELGVNNSFDDITLLEVNFLLLMRFLQLSLCIIAASFYLTLSFLSV